MSEQQKHFKPDTIDTQLDELTRNEQTHLLPLPGADADMRTVQALQQIYKNQASQEAQSIERVFNRFVQHAANTNKDREHLPTQTTALLNEDPLAVPIKIGQTYEGRVSRQRRHYSTLRQTGVAIAAFLALALIAGSAISFLLIANMRVGTAPTRPVTNAVQTNPTMVYTIAPTVTLIPRHALQYYLLSLRRWGKVLSMFLYIQRVTEAFLMH